ncbi:MAG: hypothetical protein KDC85_10945 [Saprospiraceae bacterium]|nr:hypothetical protein [Saprospiraceae bacterium]
MGSLNAQDIEGLNQATPFAWSGALAVQTGFYQANGIGDRSPSSIWSLSSNMNFTLYDQLNLPFSFTVGRYGTQSSYPTFGQVGLSPSYKWATLHLGHRNMTFSPYTLAGHTFLGTGIEITPGKFRFSAMYGKLRNAAEVDTTYSYVQPSFKRLGYGFKIGVGNEEQYVDLILFKAKDDAQSLVESQESITPAENLVLGVSAQFSLFKRVFVHYDVAGSIFTRDMNSLAIFIEDTPKVYETFLSNNFFEAKASTRTNLANKVSINYQHPKAFNIRFEYERIDPQYETMGAYFFANDLERLTLGSSMNLFKNKVSLRGSYGIQRNNLLKNRLETTQKNIGSANLDIHPNAQFGMNVNYSNYSIYQEAGRFDLNDTVAFNLATTTVGIVPRLNIQRANIIHSFFINANYQKSNQDNDLFFGKNQDFESQMASLNYTLVLLTSQFTLNTAINYHAFSVAGTTTELLGGTLGVNLSFLEGKWTLGLSNSLNARHLNGVGDGNTFNANLAINFRPSSAHSLGLNVGWLNNFLTASNDFSEIRGGLVYSYLIGPAGKKTPR